MSGGSFEYAYCGVDEMASQLLTYSKNPLWLAFAKHLQLVAKAMHDIEWVDSGDYGEGQEVEAVEKALGDNWIGITAQESLSQIDAIREQVARMVEDAE